MKSFVSFLVVICIAVSAAFAGAATPTRAVPQDTELVLIASSTPSEALTVQKQLSKKEQRKMMKQLVKDAHRNPADGDDKILLYILAFLLPYLAVGVVTDWDVKKLVIAVLLTSLLWLPGFIYALIVISKS